MNLVPILYVIKIADLFEVRLKDDKVIIANVFGRTKSTIQTCCMEQRRRQVVLEF